MLAHGQCERDTAVLPHPPGGPVSKNKRGSAPWGQMLSEESAGCHIPYAVLLVCICVVIQQTCGASKPYAGRRRHKDDFNQKPDPCEKRAR